MGQQLDITISKKYELYTQTTDMNVKNRFRAISYQNRTNMSSFRMTVFCPRNKYLIITKNVLETVS
jgi:hypothetical protein